MKLSECLGHGLLATFISHALASDVIEKVLVGVLVAVISTTASHFVKRGWEKLGKKQ